MAFCESCGARLGEGARFCRECGTPVPDWTEAREGVNEQATEVEKTQRVLRPQEPRQPQPQQPIQPQRAQTTTSDTLAQVQRAGQMAERALLGIEAPSSPGETVIGTWQSAPGVSGALGAAGSVAATASSVATVARSVTSAASSVTSAGMTATEAFAKKRAAQKEEAAQQAQGSKLPSRLIGIGVLLIAAALALFLISRISPSAPQPEPGDVLSDAPPAAAKPTAEEKPTDGTQPGNDGSKPTDGIQPGNDGAQPANGTQPSNTNPPEEQKPSEPSSSQFSTSEKPTIKDFSWYRDNIANAEPGASATMLYSFDSLQGGWKAYIYNEPLVEGAGVLEELLNVSISGSAPNTTVTFDWYWARNKDTNDNWENTQDDTVYTGKLTNGRFDAEGQGQIHLTNFWVDGNKEYGVGYIDWPDSGKALIALVRP